jgi:fructose-1,6-bisphosphatase/inositol monophosphatase family enzyme
LVQEAGGTLCDFDGKNDYLFGSSIVADNQGIHAALMEIIENRF